MVDKLAVEMRKIQKTVDGTYLISLPKGWAKRFNLRKSSPIYVKERVDGCLVLDPQYAVDVTPHITLRVSERLEDDILICYLLGYEVVTIESPNVVEHRERIKRAINRLIGFEIIEEDSQRVTLQCLLKASAFSPEKVLRREYVLSSSMYRDAFNSLMNRDLAAAKSIQERDEEIDRLYFLLVRLLRTLVINPRLSEKLGISLIDCLDYRLIASLIENIADQAVEIANCTLSLQGQKTLPELHELMGKLGEDIRLTYEEAVKAIFSKDERILTAALQKRRETQADIRLLDEALNKFRPQVSPALYTLSSTLHRILDSLTDMIDLVTPKWQT